MKSYTINFLRTATAHERAHGAIGPLPETTMAQARSKTAARIIGRKLAKERGWRLMDVREVAG